MPGPKGAALRCLSGGGLFTQDWDTLDRPRLGRGRQDQ